MNLEGHPALTEVERERAHAVLDFLADPHTHDGEHVKLMRGYLDDEPVSALLLFDCASGSMHVAAIFLDAALASRFTTPFGPMPPYEDPIVIDPSLN